MKKFIALLLCGILTATALTGCGSSSAGGENGEVIVYNWGEYIDPDTITMFEKETGIKVVYDEFETNEIMYPKVEAGSSAYDVVCPSDYMVQKMIENDLIQELDYDKIPNAPTSENQSFFFLFKTQWNILHAVPKVIIWVNMIKVLSICYSPVMKGSSLYQY